MLFGTRIIVLHLIAITGLDRIGCHTHEFTAYNSLIKHYIDINRNGVNALYT